MHVCSVYPITTPSPSEAVRWFSTVLEATELPVVLYNIPGNVGQILAPEVVERLADKVAGSEGQWGDPDLMKRYLKALGAKDGLLVSWRAAKRCLPRPYPWGPTGLYPPWPTSFPICGPYFGSTDRTRFTFPPWQNW